MRSSRPVTSIDRPSTRTKRSSWLKNSDRRKKLPSKEKLNGCVTNVLAACWLAVAPCELPMSVSEMSAKSILARRALSSSWTTSERTSSSAGTALPSRTTVA